MKMYEAAPGHFIPEGQTLDTMYKGDAMQQQVWDICGVDPFEDLEEDNVQPTITKTQWVTREGVSIDVGDMTDSHLRNTILMLRRNCDRIRMGEIWGMSCYIDTAPDGAADACEDAIREIETMSNEGFLLMKYPCFALMLQEADRRKLDLTPTGKVDEKRQSIIHHLSEALWLALKKIGGKR